MNEEIKNSLFNGNLIVFLGAGASVNSKNGKNEKLPLGNKLGEILAEDLGKSYNPKSDSLQGVYGAYNKLRGTEALHTKLFEIFGNCKPSEEYKTLSKLPLFRVYTLNIDDSLEKTIDRFSPITYKVHGRNDFIKDISTAKPELSIIKLNGDVRNLNNGLIFSASEYAKNTVKNNLWYQELARDLARYTFLFIGTQLNEPLLNFHIEQYKNLNAIGFPKSYLMIPDISEFDKVNLEDSNIEYIKGTLGSFNNWVAENIPETLSYQDIVEKKNPYMKIVNSLGRAELDELLPTTSSITDLNEVISSIATDFQAQPSVKNFYNGFKPNWFDIVNNVPSLLNKVHNFLKNNFIDKTPLNNSLYLIYGAAGCGKTTALMQLAYQLKQNQSKNVYFIDRNYEELSKIIDFLDRTNTDSYYVLIDKIIKGYDELSEIIKKRHSRAVFIISEDIKIWEYRAKEYLGEFITGSIDLSLITKQDVPRILEKVELYGKWTRLAKMSQDEREKILFDKSKKQLLIGLLETTSGEGYEKIIFNDFESIKSKNEQALLLLASITSVQNLPSSEVTLSRALNNLGYSSNSIHFLVSKKLAGILNYQDGLVSTRHRVYSGKLFDFITDKNELKNIIVAYINAFTTYDSPIVTKVPTKAEGNVFKHLVNFKFLNRILKENQELIIEIYKTFEKRFEHEGLFLMQYGLALRAFGNQREALRMLITANDAFPQSNHIEHALAHQKLILACAYPEDVNAHNYLIEAQQVLMRLSKVDMKGNHDKYPIVTLSKGHLKFLLATKQLSQAKEKAAEYSNFINTISNWKSDEKLKNAYINLVKFATTDVETLNWNEK